MTAAALSLQDALRAEFSRLRAQPEGTLATIGFNAVAVTVLWFLLPRHWFFTFTGPPGYALALAMWMYADVTATNVLTPARDVALLAIEDKRSLLNLLTAVG